MVLKFTGPDCCPDEPQIIQNRADVHASGELDDAGDVSAEGQVIAKMARHGGAIVRDQHSVIGFDPDQDVWIGCALDRCGLFTNQVHTHGRFHPRKLGPDQGRDMLIEQEADHDQAEMAV